MAHAPAPVLSAKPTLGEVEGFLKDAMAASAFVDFRYEPQLPPAKSPSAMAQKADTVVVGPPDRVKAWVGPVSSGAANLWLTKEAHKVLRCRTMNRRVKTNGGELSRWYGPNSKGQYCWRTYRLEGLKLDTVEVVVAGRRYKAFPNVPAPVV
jgi:hypothetical protein